MSSPINESENKRKMEECIEKCEKRYKNGKLELWKFKNIHVRNSFSEELTRRHEKEINECYVKYGSYIELAKKFN